MSFGKGKNIALLIIEIRKDSGGWSRYSRVLGLSTLVVEIRADRSSDAPF